MKPWLPAAVLLVLLSGASADPDFDKAIAEGNDCYDHARWGEARACYERAAQLDPKSAEALAGVAATYAQEDRREKAVEVYRAALALDPPAGLSAGIYKELGLTYGHLGKFPESIEAFESGLKLAPNDAALWRNLGVSHAMRQDWEKALQAYQESFRLDPNNPRIQKMIDEVRRNLPEGAAKAPEAPADPDAIQRPEYKNKAKALKRNLASIRGMLVMEQANGQQQGMTNAVIAASSPLEGNAQVRTGFVRPVGEEMQISLDEAVRAIRVRYPFWESSEILFSFQDKYTPKDGGSAGMAFALVLLSLLEDLDLDPDFAVTGDITVDWKIQPVGGVPAKIRGALLDGSKYVLLPQGNQDDVADLILLYPREVLAKVQIFSVATLQDALKLVPKHRDERCAKAMASFAEAVQGLDLRAEKVVIDPTRVRLLEEVLSLCPNHLSAATLLKIADGKAPKRLSPKASLAELMQRTSMLQELMPDRTSGVTYDMLSKEDAKRIRASLQALAGIADEGEAALLKAFQNFLKECENVAALSERFDKAAPEAKGAAFKQLQAGRDKAAAARQAVRKTMESMSMDRAFLEKMLR